MQLGKRGPVKQGFLTDITIVTPTIPPRAKLLSRAMESVAKQTWPPDAISIAVDHARFGAAVTRNRALFSAQTTWIAFLDDDDTLKPQHLMRLKERQEETGADVVVPWFDVVGGRDPIPGGEHLVWDPQRPYAFPITNLVRRELALDVGGFPEIQVSPTCAGEDWYFWLALRDAGAKIIRLFDRTWNYHMGHGNTSGLNHRW